MLSCKAPERVGRVNDRGFLDFWDRCLINDECFLIDFNRLNFSFHLLFIVPDARKRPDLQTLVFGARYQELLIF